MIAVPALLPAAVLLAAATGAADAEPTDYAYAWPLATPGDGGAFQVELTPEIHAVLVDPSLLDLEVFDGSGRPVPVARYEPPPAEPVARTVPLPVFVLPRRPGDGAWDVRLRVERGPDRSLRQVAAEVGAEGAAPSAADYLLDASRLEAPVAALVLSWTPRPGATTARFAVEGSEDLEHWTVLVPAAAVVSLHADGKALERREIPVPSSRWSYLRLRALDRAHLGDLRVEAELVPAPAAPERRWIGTTLASEETRELPGGGRRVGIYTYEVPGWFDVEAVRLEPVGRRVLSQVTVRSVVGEGGNAAWLPRGGFTLVDVRQGEEAVIRDEATLSPGPRSRSLRIEATPPFERAPELFVAPRPDRIAFLAEGTGPYRLAAGSGSARRTEAPVPEALAELRRRFGRTWEPPIATPGAREVLGGERALEPAPEPLPWKSWILWAVLAGGAGLVVALAVRLLRPAGRGAQGQG
jgi:hypothetical protein